MFFCVKRDIADTGLLSKMMVMVMVIVSEEMVMVMMMTMLGSCVLELTMVIMI